MSSRRVGTCPTQASEVQGARLELVGDDVVIRYWKGGAVGGLGQRALKSSALKAIPHGFRLRWMVGGDLKRVSVSLFKMKHSSISHLIYI